MPDFDSTTQQMFNQMWQQVFGKQPRMCIWKAPKGARFAFGYNTEPLTPTVRTKYRKWGAVKYRRFGDGRLQVVHVLYCASRKAAKARSLKWHYASVAKRTARASKRAQDAGNFDDRADAFAQTVADIREEKGLVVCAYCGEDTPQETALHGENGTDLFCSEDCRRQQEQDAGACRAGQVAEAYD